MLFFCVSSGGAGAAPLKFRYVYQYLDHLGNVRLSYSDLDKSGDIDKATEIIEENNYYPFGLKHRGYNEIVNSEQEHKFRFNNTEFDDDFDLNWYNMPLRHQDPTTGRWNGIDPVTHFSSSTYSGYNNNPVYWADPSGADWASFWSGVKSFFGGGSSSGMPKGYGKVGGSGGSGVGGFLGKLAFNWARNKALGKIFDGGGGAPSISAGLGGNGNKPNGIHLGYISGRDYELTLELIFDLNRITGLILSINKKGMLIYDKDSNGNPIIGNEGSISARKDLMKIINNGTDMVEVVQVGKRTGNVPGSNMIYWSPSQILDNMLHTDLGLNQGTLGFGLTFLHELLHTLLGVKLNEGGIDPVRGNEHDTGVVVDRVNIYRQELDKNPSTTVYYGTRSHYVARLSNSDLIYSHHIIFILSDKTEKNVFIKGSRE